MANQWVRLWLDMPQDTKWRTIARISKQRIGDVVAVFCNLMVGAANTQERGVTQCDAEGIATSLDIKTEDVQAIISAMIGRVLEVVSDDDNIEQTHLRLIGWEKRQPAREDNSSERTRAYREKKRLVTQDVTPGDASVTPGDAPDTDTDTDTEKELKGFISSAGADSSSGDDIFGETVKANIEKLPVPYEKIVSAYHEILPECPAVRVLTDKRKKTIKARWYERLRAGKYSTQEEALAYWRKYFKEAAKSPFLTGRAQPTNGRPVFVADIDFLFNQSNFVKFIEGKYHRE